jgi:hypothetical protein
MSQAMPLSRRLTILGLAMFAIALSVLVPAVNADDKAPGTADKVESMLKQDGFFYQRIDTPGQPTTFKIVFQDSKNRTSVMIFRLLAGSWKYNDGASAEMLYGFTTAIDQAKLPAEVGEQVAEFNDSLVFTAGSVNPESGVFAYVGFYTRGLDPESLSGYVVNLHFTSQGLKEKLEPIIKASASEN